MVEAEAPEDDGQHHGEACVKRGPVEEHRSGIKGTYESRKSSQRLPKSPTGYEENQPSLDLTKGNKKTTLILHREEGGMKTSLSLSLSLSQNLRASLF
jgi:hypothetical protein